MPAQTCGRNASTHEPADPRGSHQAFISLHVTARILCIGGRRIYSRGSPLATYTKPQPSADLGKLPLGTNLLILPV